MPVDSLVLLQELLLQLLQDQNPSGEQGPQCGTSPRRQSLLANTARRLSLVGGASGGTADGRLVLGQPAAAPQL